VVQAAGGDDSPIHRSILSSAGASATGNRKEKEDETPKKVRENKSEVDLVRELQRLFAYMTLSNRKMVDPSAVMHAVLDSSDKKSHGLKVGKQEDVSEFNHIFLQRLQEGLTICYNSVQTEAGENTGHSNVIERLFQGKVLQDLTSISATGERLVVSSNACDVVEIILDVIHEDLHTALKNYVDCVIDGYQHSQEEQSHRIEKSLWFQELPPILTFYLNRVSFDKELEAPVKIHSQFKFPTTLYMDRYLEEHRREVTQTRKEVSRLCQEIDGLEGRLKSLTRYASPDSKLTPEQAVPKEESFKAVVSLLQNGCIEESNSDMEACISLLSRCLKVLVSEREELEDELRSLVGRCDEAYRHMKKNKYSLLAVLVHDGLATGGHYWAYIKDGMSGEHVVSEGGSGGRWFKYSDTHVTHVEEEEVWRVSEGGRAYVSAYCLVYQTTDLSEEHVEREGVTSGGISLHIRKEVEDDNRLVEEQVKIWQCNINSQELCSELDKESQELERAHSSGSGQRGSASPCMELDSPKKQGLKDSAMEFDSAGQEMDLDSTTQERLKDDETSCHTSADLGTVGKGDEHETSMTQKRKPCKFFARGRCKNSECQWMHGDADENSRAQRPNTHVRDVMVTEASDRGLTRSREASVAQHPLVTQGKNTRRKGRLGVNLNEQNDGHQVLTEREECDNLIMAQRQTGMALAPRPRTTDIPRHAPLLSRSSVIVNFPYRNVISCAALHLCARTKMTVAPAVLLPSHGGSTYSFTHTDSRTLAIAVSQIPATMSVWNLVTIQVGVSANQMLEIIGNSPNVSVRRARLLHLAQMYSTNITIDPSTRFVRVEGGAHHVSRCLQHLVDSST
jgi:hypothetical protein